MLTYHHLKVLLGFNPRARDGREVAVKHCQYRNASFNPRARDGRES